MKYIEVCRFETWLPDEELGGYSDSMAPWRTPGGLRVTYIGS